MYFHELHSTLTERWWYILLRSLLTLSFGLLVIQAPETALDWVLPLAALLIMLDGAIIALPLILGTTTRHLWKVVLLREVVQISVGLLLATNDALGFEVLAVLVGSLLLFRSGLELIFFVEARTAYGHRRWLLLMTALFAALGFGVLVSAFSRRTFDTDLLGLYLVFESLAHVLTARRRRATRRALASYEHAILTSPSDLPAESAVPTKPEPQPERSWLLPHLDTTRYRKILVFAPHPDDLEGFVGGLVYRLTGEVVSIIFAGGDKGVWSKAYRVMDKGDYIQVRLAESSQAARLLGVHEINYLGYLDRGVPIDEDAIRKALDQLHQHQPDLVVSFEYIRRATPYPHPDHLAAATVVRHAIARYAAADQLDYLVVSTLLPNCFVDVSGVRRIKLQALACHTTQTDLNRLIFPFLEKLISRLWGVFVGVDYAEGYRQIDIPTLRRKLGERP